MGQARMAPTKDLIMLMVVWPDDCLFCSTRTRSVFVWFGIETASGLGGGRAAARRQGLLCDPKSRHWMWIDAVPPGEQMTFGETNAARDRCQPRRHQSRRRSRSGPGLVGDGRRRVGDGEVLCSRLSRAKPPLTSGNARIRSCHWAAPLRDPAPRVIDIGPANASPWCHGRLDMRACKRVFKGKGAGAGGSAGG